MLHEGQKTGSEKRGRLIRKMIRKSDKTISWGKNQISCRVSLLCFYLWFSKVLKLGVFNIMTLKVFCSFCVIKLVFLRSSKVMTFMFWNFFLLMCTYIPHHFPEGISGGLIVSWRLFQGIRWIELSGNVQRFFNYIYSWNSCLFIEYQLRYKST